MGKLFSTCLLNNLINFEDSISNNNNIPENSKKILHFLFNNVFFSFEFLLLSLKFSVFLKVGNVICAKAALGFLFKGYPICMEKI